MHAGYELHAWPVRETRTIGKVSEVSFQMGGRMESKSSDSCVVLEVTLDWKLCMRPHWGPRPRNSGGRRLRTSVRTALCSATVKGAGDVARPVPASCARTRRRGEL